MINMGIRNDKDDINMNSKKPSDHNTDDDREDYEDYYYTGPEPSHYFTGPIPEMEPGTYFSLTATPEGMKPIVDLETRMCIGYYDKEGHVYDFQYISIGKSVSAPHLCHDSDASADILHDFSKEIWFSPLYDRLRAESSIRGRISKRVSDYFRNILQKIK